MPHDALYAMPPFQSAFLRAWAVWVRVCATVGIICGCGIFAGGSAAAAVAIPAHLTTESYIYTGPTTTLPPPPPPPKNFEISYREAFATFVHLSIKYNSTYNFTKIVAIYDDPKDKSSHQITIKIGPGGLDPLALYNSKEDRLGFKFRLGGLYKRMRYAMKFTGFQGNRSVAVAYLSFLTGENDGEDNIYNLTGIFLVLGISTIIMAVVMVCVGYEKLIHEKSQDCCKSLCCRGRKNKIPKSSISPEPLMVSDTRAFEETTSVHSADRF